MDEQGSTLPLFVGLLVVGLVVLGLAIDVAGAHAAYVRTAAAADAVGEAAASMIAADDAHAGVVALDPVAAEGEALRVAALRVSPSRRSRLRPTASVLRWRPSIAPWRSHSSASRMSTWSWHRAPNPLWGDADARH